MELAKQIRKQLGESFEKAFSSCLKLLSKWTEAVTGQIGQRSETYAELYRAQAGRSSWKHELMPDEIHAVEEDLILLGGSVALDKSK